MTASRLIKNIHINARPAIRGQWAGCTSSIIHFKSCIFSLSSPLSLFIDGFIPSTCTLLLLLLPLLSGSGAVAITAECSSGALQRFFFFFCLASLFSPYFTSRRHCCCCCCLSNNRGTGGTVTTKRQLFAIIETEGGVAFTSATLFQTWVVEEGRERESS